MNNEITTKNLLNVIDFEISKFDNEVSRAGWNFWILLASLASVIWLLLEELEANQQNWQHSLFIYLVASLLLEVVGSFRSLLSTTSRTPILNRFYSSNTYFGSLRTSYMFIIVRNLVILAIIFFVKGLLDFYWIILAFYGLYTFVALLILVASYFDIPIRKRKNTKGNFLNFLISIICVFILIKILFSIITGAVAINIIEYKVGFLFFGISFLASSILTVAQNPYYKDSLMNVRRDFLLGNLNFEEAKRQVEILLLGMRVADLMSKEIDLLTELIQSQANTFLQTRQKYEELLQSLSMQKISKMKKDELLELLEQIITLTAASENDINKVQKLSMDLDRQIEITTRKMSVFGIDIRLEKEIEDKLAGEMNITHERIQEMRQYIHQLDSFRKSMERRVKALLRKR